MLSKTAKLLKPYTKRLEQGLQIEKLRNKTPICEVVSKHIKSRFVLPRKIGRAESPHTHKQKEKSYLIKNEQTSESNQLSSQM